MCSHYFWCLHSDLTPLNFQDEQDKQIHSIQHIVHCSGLSEVPKVKLTDCSSKGKSSNRNRTIGTEKQNCCDFTCLWLEKLFNLFSPAKYLIGMLLLWCPWRWATSLHSYQFVCLWFHFLAWTQMISLSADHSPCRRVGSIGVTNNINDVSVRRDTETLEKWVQPSLMSLVPPVPPFQLSAVGTLDFLKRIVKV